MTLAPTAVSPGSVAGSPWSTTAVLAASLLLAATLTVRAADAAGSGGDAAKTTTAAEAAATAPAPAQTAPEKGGDAPAAPPRVPLAPGAGMPAKPPALERLPNGDIRMGEITLHRQARELSFPATLNLNQGVLEVIIATPEGRLHEALLYTKARAIQIQTMLYLLDLKNGMRVAADGKPQGDLVDLDIEWQGKDGKPVREPIEHWILDNRTKKSMDRVGWVFIGSSFMDSVCLADAEGNIVINYSVGNTVLDIPDRAGDDDTLFTVNDQKTEPGKDAAVRVILTPRAAKPSTVPVTPPPQKP